MPPTVDDLFPPSKRELYAKAPQVLLQVICSFQFPRVLRLEAEAPAAFQEAIKRKFPFYEKRGMFGLPQQTQFPPEVIQLLTSQAPGGTTHQFLTEDRKSVISLTPETFSYTTNAYTHWGDFRSALFEALKALIEIYALSFFLRVSLRYTDVFNAEQLGLKGHPWVELIKPDLIGNFPFAKFEANTQQVAHKITLNLPDGSGFTTIQHGFVLVANTPNRSGRSYMIDLDFFAQPKTEIKDAESKLDHFHELAGRAFRWCISDKLRVALGPQPLPDEHIDSSTLGPRASN